MRCEAADVQEKSWNYCRAVDIDGVGWNGSEQEKMGSWEMGDLKIRKIVQEIEIWS